MAATTLRFPVMGSQAEVTVLGGEASLAGWARARLDDLEQRWSRFIPDSEITRLNRSTGRPQIVSAETFDVVATAIDAWHWSEGRFDPTMATTMAAAGYDDRRGHRSTAEPFPGRHVAPATPAEIVLDPYPRSISVPAGVAIDLGGIGKGAAADLVARELLSSGADGCCVNVGGDVRLAGRPPRPEGWRIDIDLGPGLERPVVGVVDGSVCTSTTTRRVWASDLGPEHHLRNPTDGRPLRTGLLSVSIIGATAVQAEVLTKTAFAAGPATAERLVRTAGATGLLVADDGRITPLDGLAPFLAAGGREVAPA